MRRSFVALRMTKHLSSARVRGVQDDCCLLVKVASACNLDWAAPVSIAAAACGMASRR